MTNIAQVDYNDKSVVGVFGSRTRGGKIVGADGYWAIAATISILK